MQLLPRDHQVLVMVSRFSQLTTSQINALVFHEATTRIPCDRALKRLRDFGLIELVEGYPSGRRGGTAMKVYQLGREGWGMFFTGKRKIQRTIRYHALAVADVFVQVKQASRDGILDILEWQVEADAWADVAGADLRPDLYLDIGLREKRERLSLWLEVDLGGERQKQIVEKLDRYAYAYGHAEAYPRDVFPQVVFLCIDTARAHELRQIIARTPHLPSELVTVQLLADFPRSLL